MFFSCSDVDGISEEGKKELENNKENITENPSENSTKSSGNILKILNLYFYNLFD